MRKYEFVLAYHWWSAYRSLRTTALEHLISMSAQPEILLPSLSLTRSLTSVLNTGHFLRSLQSPVSGEQSYHFVDFTSFNSSEVLYYSPT